MKLMLRVIPNVRQMKVYLKQGKVHMCSPAVDGNANEALIKVLAKEFSVRKSAVIIIKGLKSRVKTIIIETI
jgi:uncharacterized protein (TIGR00251 family)